MKTNIYIDGVDARAAFGVWVVRGGGPAGPGEFGRGRLRTPANLAGYMQSVEHAVGRQAPRAYAR